MNATYKKQLFDLTNEFSIKRLTADDDDKASLFQMYSLRYQEYNKWVKPPFDKILMDQDPFDDLVKYHVGVYHKEALVAYERFLTKPNPFMFEYAYDGHFEGLQIHPSSIEVSRAVIHPNYQTLLLSNKFRAHTVVSLLKREGFRISNELGLKYTYLASTNPVIRKGKIVGYPLETVGKATLDNGENIEVVRFTWEDFQQQNKKNTAMLDWFQL